MTDSLQIEKIFTNLKIPRPEKLRLLLTFNSKILRKTLYTLNPNAFFIRKNCKFYLKHFQSRYADRFGRENLIQIYLFMPLVVRDIPIERLTWFECILLCIDREILPLPTLEQQKTRTFIETVYMKYKVKELRQILSNEISLSIRNTADYVLNNIRPSKKSFIEYYNLIHPDNLWEKNLTNTKIAEIQRSLVINPRIITKGTRKNAIILSRLQTDTYVYDCDHSSKAHKALNAILPPKNLDEVFRMNRNKQIEIFNKQEEDFILTLIQLHDIIPIYDINHNYSKLGIYKRIQYTKIHKGEKIPTDLTYTSSLDELLKEYKNL